MTIKLLTTTCAALVVLSAPVLAQDMNSPLTGAYIGLLGGYTNSEVDDSGLVAEPKGGDYGIFAGYKLDRFLEDSIGITGAIEVHYAWSTADDNVIDIDVEKDNEFYNFPIHMDDIDRMPDREIINNEINNLSPLLKNPVLQKNHK